MAHRATTIGSGTHQIGRADGHLDLGLKRSIDNEAKSDVVLTKGTCRSFIGMGLGGTKCRRNIKKNAHGTRHAELAKIFDAKGYIRGGGGLERRHRHRHWNSSGDFTLSAGSGRWVQGPWWMEWDMSGEAIEFEGNQRETTLKIEKDDKGCE